MVFLGLKPGEHDGRRSPLIYDYPYSSLTVYQAPIRQAFLCRPLLSFVELFVMAKTVTRGDAIAQWIHLCLHPAVPGSSPKRTIYAFSFIVFVLYLSCEKNENN